MKDLSKIEVIWYEVPGHPDFKYTSSGRIEYKGIRVKGRIYYVDGELMWYDDIKTKFNITHEQLETILYEELEIEIGHTIQIVTKSLFYLMHGAKHVEQYVDNLVENSKAVAAIDMKNKEIFIFDHVYDGIYEMNQSYNGIYEMNQSYNGVMAVLNGEKKAIVTLFGYMQMRRRYNMDWELQQELEDFRREMEWEASLEKTTTCDSCGATYLAVNMQALGYGHKFLCDGCWDELDEEDY